MAASVRLNSASRSGPLSHIDRSVEESRPLVSGFVLSVLCKAFALFNSILTIRLTLPYLGPERFGTLATVLSLGTFAAFADVGLGQALVNLAARASAKLTGRDTDLDSAVSSAFFGLCGIAAGMLSIIGVVFSLSYLNKGISNSYPALLYGVSLFVAIFALALPFSIAARILTGFQQHWYVYRWQLLGLVGSLACISLAAHLRLNELWIFAGIFLPPALAAAGTAWNLFYGQKPWLAPRLCLFRWTQARQLVLSGATPFITQASSSVIFAAPIFCMSALFGSRVAGNFYAVFRIISPLVVLCTLLTMPMWPAYARYQALQLAGATRRLLLTSLGLVIVVHLLGIVALLSAFPAIMHLVSGGMVLPPGQAQIMTAALLSLAMSLRQTLAMAVLGNGCGRLATRTGFLFGVVMSLCLPLLRGVFSQPYEVLYAFISLELILILAMLYDSRSIRLAPGSNAASPSLEIGAQSFRTRNNYARR